MASVGQGLSVAGGSGPSVAGGPGLSAMTREPGVSPVFKGATKTATKRAEKATGAAAAARTDKSSGSQQRHSIQKTMSK